MRIWCFVLIALSAGCGSSPTNQPTGPTGPSVPQYGFNWTGTFSVLSCAETGDGAGVCAASGAVGSTGIYSLTLSQSGSVVSGPFAIGNEAFPSTGGTIASDGTLSLTGTNTANGITDVVRWSLLVSNSSLAGTVTIRSSEANGSVTLTAQIVSSSHP